MSLLPGDRVAGFEIKTKLGEGGMGEVYRARDVRLDRDVAIKILPAAVAGDPDRLMRFEREARSLAALNHPHIAHLYGVEQAHDSAALVMELVDGDTLADRIARGPIPLDEALPIAQQIAEALEAAHDAGLVHRDLKPANIKVRQDGTVKVLDFGLAKAIDPQDAAGARIAPAATVTSPAMTMQGIILGTAAYMAPEQAKGRPVDRRADVWAFGCVLYEMLTGRRAFDGEDVTDTIVAVVGREPDWTPLPAATPAAVRRLLRRCLTKSVQHRLRSMGDAALEIAEAMQPADESSASRAVPAGDRTRVWQAIAMAAGVLVLVLGGLLWSAGGRGASAEPVAPSAVRLSLVPDAAQALTVSGNDRDVAISPDGRRVAYVSGNGTAIVVRDLDRGEGLRIDGVGLPHNPFFSSDGLWVGFTDGLSAIRKVSVRGGPVETVCRIDQPGIGAAWYGDTIVFAERGRVYRVAAAGGVPEPVTPPTDPQRPPLHSPTFLPGGRAVLVGVAGGATSREGGIDVVDLTTGAQKTVVTLGASVGPANGLAARFVAPHHLIYRPAIQPGDPSGQALRIVRFDLDRLETIGEPALMEEPVFITPFGGYVDFDIADNGTLVYVDRTARPNVRQLVWVHRDGREDSIDLPPRAYTYPNIAPDGRQVAFDIRDQQNDTWIWDIGRRTLRRLTFDLGFNQYAIWTHDQQRLLHIMGARIVWQRADGGGQPEQLALRSGLLAPYAFSADDRHLVFREDSADTGHDLMLLTLDASRAVVPLLQTRANELNAEISPDGRWLAYQSDESGKPEIYVRPFPDVQAGRWQVSSAGGRTPRWSHDGAELFFLALDGAMTSARIETTPAFVSHAPVRLFAHQNYVGGASSIGRTYDVAPDGRFLMIKPASPSNLAVVLNWSRTLP